MRLRTDKRHMKITSPPRPHPVRTPQTAAQIPAASAKPDWLALQQTAPTSLSQAAARLDTMARTLNARGDRRAIFATIYAVQVRSMDRELAQPGRYQDPEWMRKMSLDFAQRYFDAFDAYERGERKAVPACWLTAFDHARAAEGPAVNDLLLSMNAHINHDLPLSVAANGAETSHHADFTLFNQALKASIDEVQSLLVENFMKSPDSITQALDNAFGGLDEWGTGIMIQQWRRRAWKNAQNLRTQGRNAYPAVTQTADWNARVITTVGRLVPGRWVKHGLI